VGVFNIPLTSPPEPLDGALVTSWTSASNQYAYPTEFQTELERIGYQRQADFYSPDDPVENLLDTIEKRQEGIELFCDEYDWDLLVAMFYATEQEHHQFAGFIDPDYPLHDPHEAQLVSRVYESVDEQVGRLRSRVGEDTPFVVMSDHGFCPVYERIYINRILEDYGYYTAPDDTSSDRSLRLRLIDALKRSDAIRSAVRHAGKVPVLEDVVAPVVSSYRDESQQKSVTADWSETVAFNGYEHGGIFLNTEAENPEGIVADGEIDDLVNDIIVDLEADNYLGPRIEGAFRRESVFDGENVEALPHIVLRFRDGYFDSSGCERRKSRSATEMRVNGDTIGFHTMDGLFLADGEQVRDTSVGSTSILDIAPTVLHYFDQPVPTHYDGEVLDGVFEPDSPARERLVTHAQSELSDTDRKRSPANLDDVEDRLQDREASLTRRCTVPYLLPSLSSARLISIKM
jgi:predicted AlkP superfamily phosphohydrolase/phosphomutase